MVDTNNSGDDSPDLPESVIKEFIDVQKSELQVRIAETQVNAQDITNQKEIALKSIDAQAVDRRETRQTYQKESTKEKWFALGILLLLCSFFILLVSMNHAEMAQKIIEVVIYAILGAFGGYGWAKGYSRKDPDKENKD